MTARHGEANFIVIQKTTGWWWQLCQAARREARYETKTISRHNKIHNIFFVRLYTLCELGQVKWWGKVNIEIGQFSSTRKRELKRCRLRRCDVYTVSGAGLLQYIFPISDNFVDKRNGIYDEGGDKR